MEDFKNFCITRLHYKKDTIRNRIRYLNHLRKHVTDINCPDEIYSYFANRISNGTPGSSLNCYIKSLNAWYKYKNLDHHFTLYKSFMKPVKIPTKTDIKTLLNGCSRSRRGKRVKTLIFLLSHTGLRASEVCNLCFDDIDWQHNEIRLIGKWDRPRVIPVKSYVLHGRMVPSLKNYIKHHRRNTNDKYIFTTVKGKLTPVRLRSDIKHVARKVGISWVHPHSFRHFYATTLLRNGVNVKIVQVVMGHGNISETSRYLHAVEYDIRDAIKKMKFDNLLSGFFNGPMGIYDLDMGVCCQGVDFFV